MRVVRAEEKWTEFKVVGGKKKPVPKQSNWLWVVTEQVAGDRAQPVVFDPRRKTAEVVCRIPLTRFSKSWSPDLPGALSR